MRQKEYHIGPGAVSLLLIIVVVSMSVLGLLSLVSARGDYRLTQRALTFAVEERSAAENAERALAELDAVLAACGREAESEEEYLAAVAGNLPVGMTLEGNVVKWSEQVGAARMLLCEIEILPMGEEQRFEWRKHIYSAADAL